MKKLIETVAVVLIVFAVVAICITPAICCSLMILKDTIDYLNK